MAADPLTPDVSARICAHMNDDHADAVVAYARHYGGVSAPVQARMLEVQSDAMLLEVDGTTSHKGCAVVPARRHVTRLGLVTSWRIAREPKRFWREI